VGGWELYGWVGGLGTCGVCVSSEGKKFHVARITWTKKDRKKERKKGRKELRLQIRIK
jgi:hypothetical protein